MDARFEDGEILSALVVRYEPGADEPSEVFRAVAELVDGLKRLDHDLADAISTSIRVSYRLEEIEPGSIKSWIRTRLEETDDQDLRDLNWKRIVGRYLVAAKHLILRWIGERETVETEQELGTLEEEIQSLVRETDVLHMPTYGRVPRGRLLSDMRLLSEGVARLGEGDRASYIDPEGEIEISRQFSISNEKFEELVAIELVGAQHELILLVKRPDYLGSAQWEFVLHEQGIRAKILDEEWLERFQSRAIDVRPGDALRVEAKAEIRRTKHGEIISIRYFIVKVHAVVRGQATSQQLLLPGPDDDLDEAG